MSYSNPINGAHNFPLMDFGDAAGDTTHRIAGPAGKKGRLQSIAVATAEAFVCPTTPATVLVGTPSDPDAYGQLEIATATANNVVFNDGDDTDAIIDADIPADTVVLVTLVEGTGTGLTGQGFPTVYIDWY